MNKIAYSFEPTINNINAIEYNFELTVLILQFQTYNQ